MKNSNTSKNNGFSLCDSWQASGSGDKERLYAVLDELSKATKVVPARSDSIEMMTVRDMTDTLNVYVHNKKGTVNWGIPLEMMRNTYGADDRLLEETAKGSFILFRIGDRIFFTSKKVLKTLSQRAGSSMGDFAMRDEVNIRFPRDTGYVNYMCTVPSQCSVLCREYKGANKIYAVFTDRYKLLPQYPLVKQMIEGFEKEMGESTLLRWSVDHYNTEVYIEFPKRKEDFNKVYGLPDEVVPGVRIHLSDTGDSSFIINGSIRLRDTVIYIPGAEYSRAHTKKADMKEMFEYVGRNIFAEYTRIPERMVELLQVPVKDPAACYEKALKFCEIRKLVGAKTEQAFLETLASSVNPALQYTAYDIAASIIEEGTSLEYTKGKGGEGAPNVKKLRGHDTLTKLRAALARAFFFRYEV